MKNLMRLSGLIIALAFVVIACQKEQIALNDSPPPLKGKMAKVEKVEICHLDEDGNYVVINVNKNALEAHLKHGDKLHEKFGKPGKYEFDFLVTEGPNTGVISHHHLTIDNNEDGIISGTSEGINFPANYTLTGTVDENGNFECAIIIVDGDGYGATFEGYFDCTFGFVGTHTDNADEIRNAGFNNVGTFTATFDGY